MPDDNMNTHKQDTENAEKLKTIKENFVTRSIKSKGTDNDRSEQYIPGSNAEEMVKKGFIVPIDKKPNFYQYTTQFAIQVNKDLEKLDKISGIVRAHAEEILQTAIANNSIIIERSVNKDAKPILENGGTGKPFTMKGKSSLGLAKGNTSNPTGGYITEIQAMSEKLSDNDVAKFQEKVDKVKKSDIAKALPLITKNEQGVELNWCYKEVSGKNRSYDYFYQKASDQNTNKYYFKNPLGVEQSYELTIDQKTKKLETPQTLCVMGTERDGKYQYFAADYDPLVYAPNIREMDPKDYSDKSVNDENVIYNNGNITEGQYAMATALKIATNGSTSHSHDVSNPDSFKEEIHKDIVNGIPIIHPDGTIPNIKNSLNPELGEQQLIASFNQARKLGYDMIPNPRWGWELNEHNELYVPDKRFDWLEARTQIDHLSDKEKELVEPIYNLEIEISYNKYRQALINDIHQAPAGENINYGTKEEGELKNKYYVNSYNYEQAVEKLAELKDKYAEYMQNFTNEHPIPSIVTKGEINSEQAPNKDEVLAIQHKYNQGSNSDKMNIKDSSNDKLGLISPTSITPINPIKPNHGIVGH